MSTILNVNEIVRIVIKGFTVVRHGVYKVVNISDITL